MKEFNTLADLSAGFPDLSSERQASEPNSLKSSERQEEATKAIEIPHPNKELVNKLASENRKGQERIEELMTKSFDELMETGESEELQKLSPENWKRKVSE